MEKYLYKYKSLDVKVKAALWFVVCSFLQKGISFITVPIFTRLLTTEQYGTYTLYLSWLQIFTIITSLYLYNGVLDNAMAKYKEDRDRYIASMQGLTMVILGVVGLIFCFIYPYIKEIIDLEIPYILLMFVEMMFTPATNYWLGRQRFEYSYKNVVALILVKSILNPFLGIVFVNFTTEKDLARVVSIVVVEGIIGGYLLFIQFRKTRIFFIKEYWAYGIKLAVPMLPHYLSGMILNQGDRIMINKIVGKSAVALYGVAYSIGMIVQIFVSAVNSAVTPWLYSKMENGEIDKIKKISNFLFLLIAVIATMFILVAPEVILVFGSEEYRNAVYVIPPIAASVYFIFLYSILSFPQFYYERTSFLMVASLIAALANIVLNYIFIQKYGYIAAGYTTLACYIVYAIGHYFVSTIILRRERKEKDICMLDKKVTIVISGVLVVITIFSNYIMENYLIRYILIAIIMILICIKRNAILSGLKEIRDR